MAEEQAFRDNTRCRLSPPRIPGDHCYCKLPSSEETMDVDSLSQEQVVHSGSVSPTLTSLDTTQDNFESLLLLLLQAHTSQNQPTDPTVVLGDLGISGQALETLSSHQIQALITSNSVNYEVVQQIMAQQKATSRPTKEGFGPNIFPWDPLLEEKPRDSSNSPTANSPTTSVTSALPAITDTNQQLQQLIQITPQQLHYLQAQVNELLQSQHISLSPNLSPEHQQQLIQTLLLRQLHLQQSGGVATNVSLKESASLLVGSKQPPTSLDLQKKLACVTVGDMTKCIETTQTSSSSLPSTGGSEIQPQKSIAAADSDGIISAQSVLSLTPQSSNVSSAPAGTPQNSASVLLAPPQSVSVLPSPQGSSATVSVVTALQGGSNVLPSPQGSSATVSVVTALQGGSNVLPSPQGSSATVSVVTALQGGSNVLPSPQGSGVSVVSAPQGNNVSVLPAPQQGSNVSVLPAPQQGSNASVLPSPQGSSVSVVSTPQGSNVPVFPAPQSSNVSVSILAAPQSSRGGGGRGRGRGGTRGGRKKKGENTSAKNDTKKAPMPYNLFFSEVYSTVMATNPKMGFSDASKIISMMWQAMGPDVKKRYYDEHNKLKAGIASQHQSKDAAASSSDTGVSIRTLVANTSPSSSEPSTTTTVVTAAPTPTPLVVAMEIDKSETAAPGVASITGGRSVEEQLAALEPAKDPKLCVNFECENLAVSAEGRGASYCSNECLTSHCRRVFNSYQKIKV